MPPLLRVFLLPVWLCQPAQAVTAVVMDMPGFAWNGKGWIPELLSRMQLNQQTIALRLLPPARAVTRFYQGGEGDLFAANLLCRRQDSHYLTLGIRDYEVFITRLGDKVPGPASLPPAGERVLVVRGFNHPFIAQHPALRWEEVSSIDKGLDMLRAHRANYFFSFLALSEDAMRAQASSSLFAYDSSKAMGEVWPALSFRQTEAGWQLAHQLRQQLLLQWQNGQYASLLQRHGLPAWHMRPGLEGRFSVVRAEECATDPHPAAAPASNLPTRP
jgi:hypothetical protein